MFILIKITKSSKFWQCTSCYLPPDETSKLIAQHFSCKKNVNKIVIHKVIKLVPLSFIKMNNTFGKLKRKL